LTPEEEVKKKAIEKRKILGKEMIFTVPKKYHQAKEECTDKGNRRRGSPAEVGISHMR
jgi:hypothetical protein